MSVRLLCKQKGYKLVEWNASDLRNKLQIQSEVSHLTNNQLFGFDKQEKNGNFVILMDEVDGMSGDKGGIGALIEIIKKTEVPIVCIANDYHQRMKSLYKSSHVIKYQRP